MNTAIFGLHTVALSTGQLFETEAHYRNVPSVGGLSMVYFETKSNDTPTVADTEHYHTWKMLDGSSLTAWMVPEASVAGVIEGK